jgi:sugar phosphate isomerase/epimerase
MPGFKNIPEEDEALVKNTALDCYVTSILGADTCVVHNVTNLFLGKDPAPELMHKLSYDMFTSFLPFAKEHNVKIATETFGDAVKYSVCDFFGYIDEFEKAYKAIKEIEELKDYFTICVDTGHSNKAMRFGNPTPADVIRRLGSEVTTLHLHDNNGLVDQHKIPMTGNIDWNDVFNALDEIGYKGVYNLELSLGHFGPNFLIETAEFAVKVMRNMLNERYGNN